MDQLPIFLNFTHLLLNPMAQTPQWPLLLLHDHRGATIAGRAAALRRAGHAEGRARLGTAGDVRGVHLRQTSVMWILEAPRW